MGPVPSAALVLKRLRHRERLRYLSLWFRGDGPLRRLFHLTSTIRPNARTAMASHRVAPLNRAIVPETSSLQLLNPATMCLAVVRAWRPSRSNPKGTVLPAAGNRLWSNLLIGGYLQQRIVAQSVWRRWRLRSRRRSAKCPDVVSASGLRDRPAADR
jgi:hypothetical protein